jgi:tetratricopeptide (TPR) repeat protein
MTTNHGKDFDFSAAKVQEQKVWGLMQQGDVKDAIDACEQLNRQYPEFASGWHTTSQLALKLQNPGMALEAVKMALHYEPDSVPWTVQKAQCLAKLGDMAQLETELEGLSTRQLKSAYLLSAVAMLYTQLGRREKAVDLYQAASKLEPKKAVHFYNVACMQRSLGELEAAEQNYDHAIRLNPADYESFKIRSDLRRQSPDRNHVAELNALLEKGVDDARGAIQIRYALAKELEDLGESKSSFEHLKAGSEQRRATIQYDVARDLETMATIQDAFSAEVFATKSSGSDNAEPVFILGMPRTGTTLVERILGSHSDVFAAGELNNFAAQLMVMLRAVNEGKRVSRDDMVRSSASLEFRRLGEAYIQSTRPMTGHSLRFIDKMPLNFLYVGLIHLSLPNAKIINLHRDPVDTCYAIYKQLFVDAYPFSYDLEELARYYVAYAKLMEHWNAVLPGVIHTVRYEDVVADLEGESRRLIDYCGLEWQEQCLKFHENKEASTTASTAQVRRPIYKSSIGRWRDYESELQPAVKVLQAAGIID